MVFRQDCKLVACISVVDVQPRTSKGITDRGIYTGLYIGLYLSTYIYIYICKYIHGKLKKGPNASQWMAHQGKQAILHASWHSLV